MNAMTRSAWLRTFLRVVSVGLLAAFIPWITLILMKAPILAPESALAPVFRFQPYNAAYESMMASVYIVWAVMLWRASSDPAKHALFIDFTIWGSAAHGLVMLVSAPLQKGAVMGLMEVVPLFGLAGVLLWLRPRPSPQLAS